MGLGLALLFSPDNLKRYAVFLAPVIGFSYLSLSGWYCYVLNMKGTDIYAWLIIMVATLVLIYAIWVGTKKGNKLLPEEIKIELLALIVIISAALLLALQPFMTHCDILTSISLGNNDIADSSSIASFLKEYSRMDTIGFLGQQPDAFKAQADTWLFGGPLSTAFFCTIFGADTYQLGSLNIIVLFVISLPIIYVLAREIFKYDIYSAVAVTAVCGLNPVMLYLCYQGFQGQIVGMGLSLSIILINITAIHKCESVSEYLKYIPLIVILNWALSLTYNYILIFVYMPILGYLVIYSFQKKDKKSLLYGSIYISLAIMVTFLLSPFRAINLVKQTIHMGTAINGWFIPWIPSIYTSITEKYMILKSVEVLLLFLCLLIFLIFSMRFYQIYKKEKEPIIIAGIFLAYVFMGYISLSYLNRAGEEWGGYKSFKWIAFFLPATLLSLFLVFRNMNVDKDRGKQWFVRSVLAFIVGMTLISSMLFITKKVSPPPFAVTKNNIAIKEINNLSEIKSVNILGNNYWDNLWAANFLIKKQLYFEVDTTYPGRRATSLNGDWDLIKTTADLLKYQESEIIKINESNYLIRRKSGLE